MHRIIEIKLVAELSTHNDDTRKVEFVCHSGNVFESIHESSVSGTHLQSQWGRETRGGIKTRSINSHS